MKKRYIVLIILLVLITPVIVFFVLTARPNGPKVDRKMQNAIKDYIPSIQADGEEYFNEFSQTAVGFKPDSITLTFRYASMDFLKADPKPVEEILTGNYPVLVVSLNRHSGESFSEEEIHGIIAEAVKRKITVDFCFDYDSFLLYQVRDDGVTIDETLAEDGGAMHRQTDYVL